MTDLAQPSDAATPLVRTLRENCVHFTEAAEQSLLWRPLLLLLAALFGRLEALFVLWRAGDLPAPPPCRRGAGILLGRAPSARPRSLVRRRRACRRARLAARPRHAAGAPVPVPVPVRGAQPVARSVPPKRIERYPKP